MFDTDVQASLRNKARNRLFHKMVDGFQGSVKRDCLVCQSDDFVLAFDCRTGNLVKWFIIKQPAKRTAMEKEMMDRVEQLKAVDRQSYPVCDRLTTDLGIVSAVVKSYLG